MPGLAERNLVVLVGLSCRFLFQRLTAKAEVATGFDPSILRHRVSLETSFDSKQPKLEPKLVSALSETKRLFWLFRFYTETESFNVSIELKQTEDQPKQLDRKHILLFFTENVGFFHFFVFFSFFGFFGLFLNSLFRLFRFYTETESFD